MIAATIVLLPLLFVSAFLAGGGKADPTTRGLAATGPTGPSSDYWHALAVKRLKGWHRMELARNEWKRIAAKRARRQYRTDVPWLNDALCVHGFESHDWFWRGHHFGGMQFNLGTWHGAGGYGNPADAHPIEQLYRAFIVWRRDGGSWREWTTAPLCGLR